MKRLMKKLSKNLRRNKIVRVSYTPQGHSAEAVSLLCKVLTTKEESQKKPLSWAAAGLRDRDSRWNTVAQTQNILIFKLQ